MKTPICDFVREYGENKALRLHMPGHKGRSFLGAEGYDITEINGADSLYTALGIIAESEKNASMLFGASTFYSAEGSSQCIRAMLYLASIYAAERGQRLKVAAQRNVHKTFIYAVAALDADVTWLLSERDNYLCGGISADEAERLFEEQSDITALYVTSPDYLGNMTSLREIADICHKNGALLLVDCAHGAYLKFLPESLHPIDMGADICCSSAHKTLPVLTGGAYLHIGGGFCADASAVKDALALFGSTSPSYLILQSLDMANKYIYEGYRERLSAFLVKLSALRERLKALGYVFLGDEPMKLTIMAKKYGYLGTELGEELRKKGIESEFCDPDFLVLMPTPEIDEAGLSLLEKALASIEKRDEITEKPPIPFFGRTVISIREAIMSPSETVSVRSSIGRILASPSVGCPPAVPVLVCGEVIDEAAQKAFEYYGIERVSVVK